MGSVEKEDDFVGDSELNRPTPAYQRHTEIRKIIKEEFPEKELHRCGFLSLPTDAT